MLGSMRRGASIPPSCPPGHGWIGRHDTVLEASATGAIGAAVTAGRHPSRAIVSGPLSGPPSPPMRRPQFCRLSSQDA